MKLAIMQKFSPSKASRFLFAVAVILLPFNALPLFGSLLGEMAGEGAFYPLLVALCIWTLMLLGGTKIKLPKHSSAKLLIVLFLWTILSAVVNFVWIVSLETKGRTGPEKLILQLAVILFVMLSALLIYNVVCRTQHPLHSLRRYVLISFLVAGLYSLIEIGVLLGSSFAAVVLQTIDPVIRYEQAKFPLYFGRLRSVSGEASWFAMYCSFVFPWILSYAFTKQRQLWAYSLLLIYSLLVIMLTQSRTAYVITLFELTLFCSGLFFVKFRSSQIRLTLFKKNRLLFFIAIIALTGLCGVAIFSNVTLANTSVFEIFLSLVSNDDFYQLSNMTRYGSQTAAFSMALGHPFFGVGLGQYGFYLPSYVPEWALSSVEIQNAISSTNLSTWPSVYNVYARLAAELGWIGLGIWILLWASVITACYKRYQFNNRMTGKCDVLGLALIVSIIGVLLSGLNTDSLRFFGFWINLGVAWCYLRKTEILAIKTNV